MMMTAGEGMLELEYTKADAVNSTNGHHMASQPRFVCFQLGSGSYCVPADDVAEVAHPLAVTKLPGGAAPLMGIASLRGEIVAVIDLRTMLNEKPPAFSSKPKFVVVMSPGGECPVAMPVDGMRDMISAQPADLSAETPNSPFIKGSISMDGINAGVVDIGELRNTVTRCTA
ncbi:MAG: chemotaxis protein CheW [Acidobacteria bacterium]|nr:chemotaxis protein CheW [Acidobacteriota bacterium]